mgnify:CR=1 FL=1
MSTVAYRFLTRGGTAANLATVNEVPLARELVVETDTGKMKLGDGETNYNDLAYIGDLERLGAGSDGDFLRFLDGAPAWGGLELGNLVAGSGVTLSGTLTGRLFGSGNVTIHAAGGGGGGAVELISQVVTSGSQSTVSFTSIPSIFAHLELRILGRGDATATNVEGRIQFNGDTANNYDLVRENRFGNVNAAGTAYLGGFSLPAATAPSGAAGAANIEIPGYTTSFHKSVVAKSVMKEANTTPGLYAQNGGGFWRNTSVIEQIDVFLSSGNWADGSVVSLYGIG